MTQMPNTFQFTCADKDGEKHTYDVCAHPPEEGMEILWVLAALGGEPLARLAESVIADALQAAGETKTKVVEIDESGTVRPSLAMSKIMDQIDLEKVDFVGAAKDLRMVIATLPMSKMVYRLLKYATRDGKPLTTEKNSVNFDLAYTANYFEMLHAAGRVIAVNGFLPHIVTSLIE